MDVDAAVAAAKEGFKVWRAMTGAERGRILIATANVLRERVEELATLEVRDTGKPIAEAREVDVFWWPTVSSIWWPCSFTHGEHFDLDHRHSPTHDASLRGLPGHWGLELPNSDRSLEVSPCSGGWQCHDLRPSEMTPRPHRSLPRSSRSAGCQMAFLGSGQGQTGQALAHAGIRKVSLTGSVPTAGRSCSQQLQPQACHQGLGGKSPLIVFKDSHLDNAVSAAMMANFYTQGEICSNGTRTGALDHGGLCGEGEGSCGGHENWRSHADDTDMAFSLARPSRQGHGLHCQRARRGR